MAGNGGNGAIPIIGARKPNKKNDFATLAQVEGALTEALNKIDAIHQFYLQQLPAFIANMVVDGLVAHGLIPEPPKASDAPPAEMREEAASVLPPAASDAPAPTNTP